MAIAEKIRKLIEHEKSARSIGNVAEAEAFTAKIQEMLLRHKLEMSDVEMLADPLGLEPARAPRTIKRAEDWSQMIAKGAAGACMCEAIAITGVNALVFLGRGGDRKLAISIWQFLYALAIEISKADVRELAKRSRMHPVKLRGRYLMGFAVAIALRLAKEKAATVEAAGVPGIVRINSEEKALAAYRDDALKLKTTALSIPRNSVAFNAGFIRGAKAPLRKQHTLAAKEGAHV